MKFKSGDKVKYKDGDKKMEKTQKQKEWEESIGKCFKCGKEQKRGEMHYWYHGDQDDLICTECAGQTKHIDTAYAGITVKGAI